MTGIHETRKSQRDVARASAPRISCMYHGLPPGRKTLDDQKRACSSGSTRHPASARCPRAILGPTPVRCATPPILESPVAQAYFMAHDLAPWPLHGTRDKPHVRAVRTHISPQPHAERQYRASRKNQRRKHQPTISTNPFLNPSFHRTS